jgi:asparagine synthase (glutamine-hydrolysing)
MCGICGIYTDTPLNISLLKEMTDTITHRGPDDDGYFIEGGVGLGMRRLSIIDIKGGKQPILSENGQVVVVCNGEIYNYLQLRTEMIERGHVFNSNSDTECIVHLYEEYGMNFISHLRGMYAIALYDRKKKHMIFARDRLGKKPLYYAIVNNKLIFGSEIKPILLAAPELRRVDQTNPAP